MALTALSKIIPAFVRNSSERSSPLNRASTSSLTSLELSSNVIVGSKLDLTTFFSEVASFVSFAIVFLLDSQNLLAASVAFFEVAPLTFSLMALATALIIFF